MKTKLITVALLSIAIGCGEMSSGTVDAGTKVDAGTVVMTGDAGPPAIHGCSASSFIDRRTGSRDIGFGTELGSPALGYTPQCMIISVGQSAKWVGNFSTHPLVGGEYNGTAGTTPNPIARHDTGSTPVEVTFNAAGLYPYYCDYHAPTMVGVIWVQ